MFKRSLQGVLISLFSTAPLWVPAAILLPWLWTLDKNYLGIGLSMGLFLGCIISVIASLIISFAIILETREKGIRKEWIMKRFWINVSDTLPNFFGGAILLGYWLDLATGVFKHWMDNPRGLGTLILLSPIALLALEVTRIGKRRTALEDLELPAKKLRFWKSAALLQSFVVLAIWLGLMWVSLAALHQGIQNFPETWGYYIWILLTLSLVSLWAYLGLFTTEKWLFRKGIIPWQSAYPLPPFRFKRRDAEAFEDEDLY